MNINPLKEEYILKKKYELEKQQDTILNHLLSLSNQTTNS